VISNCAISEFISPNASLIKCNLLYNFLGYTIIVQHATTATVVRSVGDTYVLVYYWLQEVKDMDLFSDSPIVLHCSLYSSIRSAQMLNWKITILSLFSLFNLACYLLAYGRVNRQPAGTGCRHGNDELHKDHIVNDNKYYIGRWRARTTWIGTLLTSTTTRVSEWSNDAGHVLVRIHRHNGRLYSPRIHEHI